MNRKHTLFQLIMTEASRYQIKKIKTGEIIELTVRPASVETWPALEDLFGEKGACNGCWCMYWRIGNQYNKRSRDLNKSEFQQIIKNGPPPGIMAFHHQKAVGWCQVTPRIYLPYLENLTGKDQPADQDIWSISCFYIRSKYRRLGLTSILIKEALKIAQQANARLLEAYPVDKKDSRSISYTGYVSTFRRTGFKLTGQKVFTRQIMQHDLKASK